MFAKGSPFYLFLMLAQINFIFSDNVHIFYIYGQSSAADVKAVQTRLCFFQVEVITTIKSTIVITIWLTVTKYPSNDNGSFSFDVFLSSIAVKTFTELYMSRTPVSCKKQEQQHAGVLQKAGTAYPSLAPRFIPGFWWGSYCSSVQFSSPCCVFEFVCLHSVSCVSNVASGFQFLIALRFSLTFIC